MVCSKIEHKGKTIYFQIFEFKYVLCLVMLNHIPSLMNGLSKALQDPNLDFSAGMSLIDATLKLFRVFNNE